AIALATPVPISLILWSPLVRAYTQAAPAPILSASPPTKTTLPSPDTATDVPCKDAPTLPGPTSFVPSCVNWALAGMAAPRNATDIQPANCLRGIRLLLDARHSGAENTQNHFSGK